MPEGDTVYLSAFNLDRALKGQVLRRSDLRVPRLATVDLSGTTITEVVARGKHLLFRLDDDRSLHVHFMMDGSFHLYRPDQSWRDVAHEARVVLETDPWHAVGFRIPIVEVIPRERESDVVGHLGPDLLGPDWDAVEALRRLSADPKRAIGTALLDQSAMAGLGNVYKSEICFIRGVNPWTSVGEVQDLDKVVTAAKRTIEANRFRPGHVTTGDLRPGRTHWVYGRAGKPCRRCGTPIERATQPGYREVDRVTFWCPSCQPGASVS